MLKDDFLHYIGSERNYSERTLKTYNQSLTLFQRHMEAQGRPIDWTAVEEGDIREWMVAMMNNGSAPTTVNNRLSALRSFYRFLIGRDLTRHDPTQRIEGPKKQKPLPHFIKESEMDRLLDHTAFPDTYEGHRDHAILQLFYTTGMRLAELVGLDTGDIDFGNHTVKVTGKRNKQRIIPLVPETETELREYLRVRHQMFHDVPHDDEDYVHRIGRTARADRDGEAVTLVSDRDIRRFMQIEKFLGREVEKTPLPEGLGDAPAYKASERGGESKSRSGRNRGRSGRGHSRGRGRNNGKKGGKPSPTVES